MNLKHRLTAATALTLIFSSGAAFAGDNNKAYLDQSGTGNKASVTQTSDPSTATHFTSGAGGNDAGTSSLNMTQNGDYNSLSLLQDANDNHFGDLGSGTGFDQIGNYNSADVEQNSNSNRINQVYQEDATGSATSTSNELTITQDSTFTAWNRQRNLVSTIHQVNTGGAANSIEIHQLWDINTLNGQGANDIGTGTLGSNLGDTGGLGGGVYQNGTGNTAEIDQTGGRNRVFEVNQTGVDNSAFVVLTGLRNGNTALSGASAQSGAPNASVTQTSTATGNQVSYTVDAGNDNAFGFYQDGNGNEATGIVITGDDNQLGVHQIGDGNSLTLSTISGMGNNIGLDQYGFTNTATVNISGSFNGGGTFSGAAAGVAGSNPSGLIIQHGSSLTTGLNDVSLTIDTDSNQFSLVQMGDGNAIDGWINTGTANQVAVAQTGDNNVANFTQSGDGNNIGISQ